jgi:hypothetical protein
MAPARSDAMSGLYLFVGVGLKYPFCKYTQIPVDIPTLLHENDLCDDCFQQYEREIK